MTQNMETVASRLASFDLVLQPEKRRNSSAKAAEPIAWPHRSPSPSELAHAGFYYHPYETNPDNTVCFLCRRALDGWEEEDNPVAEHLKHSSDCGWAIMMDIQQHSSNPAEIQDPTSEQIYQARLATFNTGWPHDGKRGWTCQSEKMVEGGWYFCPNEESNDLASCPYCKLSLDGWEPKDDPFDEHYRRSAECSFFVFAQPPGKKGKGSRSKKARASKVSRLSTQSTVSEAPSELDGAMDQSILSQTSTTKSKSTKKSSKTRTKDARSKKEEEADQHMDLDAADVMEPVAEPEPPKAKRATRGKKRSSEDVQMDDMNIARGESVEETERPSKKRATRSRASSQPVHDYDNVEPMVTDEDQGDSREEVQEAPKKGRGAGKKKGSGKGRKASSASSTSKTIPHEEEPGDLEITAAIEADLEQDHVEPVEPTPEVTEKPAKKSKKKGKKNDTATEETGAALENRRETKEPAHVDELVHQEKPNKPGRRQKARASDDSQSTGRAHTETPAPESPPRDTQRKRNEKGTNMELHESFVSVEIPARESEQPAEVKTSQKPKKESKKGLTGRGKKSKKTEETSTEPIAPAVAPPQPRQDDAAEEPKKRKSSRKQKSDDQNLEQRDTNEPPQHEEAQEPEPERRTSRRRSSMAPPKTTERYSDIPQEEHLAEALAESRRSTSSHRQSGGSELSDHIAQKGRDVSPLPDSKSSPSMSPQSSDAENRPPSLRPSASRPPVLSPAKPIPGRLPLAPSTPTPIKKYANRGGIDTAHAWRPADVDEILLASNSDKENLDLHAVFKNIQGELTSEEKKMTVAQWIQWNAKNGEERLRRECERLVGQFEKEGARAMRALEGIECSE
ncbi:hypothetical protein BDW42DRAFT_59281 [Aspergillus taichungensis]|uniref:Chromosome segregation protein BIR1 n=1 Tax=Aspergillus taichungensis TaxID=482145 RepID=A0A2J5I1U3_9EURO|nr:hypothetical protein BDW42DRAFT_59281 [Aspergillus taichungensis]